MIEQQNNQDITTQIRFVSHEIRNHLSICDMYSQIIKRNLEREGIFSDSIDNALDCIQQSIQIMSTNLIELKSLNTNSPKVVDFKTVVLKGVQLSKPCISDKEISFDVFIKDTDNIFIDENKFLACIVNIIKNGIESIDSIGNIYVYGEKKAGKLVLKIGNNGKSIPKDKQLRIFEEGFTTKETGSGFGLNICKNYLKSQGAELKLNKSTRAVTQFDIIIPIHNNN